jgi:hypothetical protein
VSEHSTPDERDFVKHDAEKPRWTLLPWLVLAAVVRVLTKGAKKYAPFNWQKCKTPFHTYGRALFRHWDAFVQGESHDPETGESHLIHAIVNLLFLAWFELTGKLTDRP